MKNSLKLTTISDATFIDPYWKASVTYTQENLQLEENMFVSFFSFDQLFKNMATLATPEKTPKAEKTLSAAS